jgi:hypothetical protein
MWRLLVRSCSSSSSRQHKQQQQRLAGAVGNRCYTIGGTTEGGSQKKHEELQARLPPFVPKPEPVTIVHKQVTLPASSAWALRQVLDMMQMQGAPNVDCLQ